MGLSKFTFADTPVSQEKYYVGNAARLFSTISELRKNDTPVKKGDPSKVKIALGIIGAPVVAAAVATMGVKAAIIGGAAALWSACLGGKTGLEGPGETNDNPNPQADGGAGVDAVSDVISSDVNSPDLSRPDIETTDLPNKDVMVDSDPVPPDADCQLKPPLCSLTATVNPPLSSGLDDGYNLNWFSQCATTVVVAEGDVILSAELNSISPLRVTPDGKPCEETLYTITASNSNGYCVESLSLSPSGRDSDGDGLSDSCEIKKGTSPYNWDTDDDGISDYFDNCPVTPNPDQLDSNNNGVGDACEINTAFNCDSVTITDKQTAVDALEDLDRATSGSNNIPSEVIRFMNAKQTGCEAAASVCSPSQVVESCAPFLQGLLCSLGIDPQLFQDPDVRNSINNLEEIDISAPLTESCQ